MTTLAHYLELLAVAGILVGLQKFVARKVCQRRSSPKSQVLNNALINAQTEFGLAQAKEDRAYGVRLVESAVGAHLANSSLREEATVCYWREGGREADHGVKRGRSITAIDVKTGRAERRHSGLDDFSKAVHPKRVWLVGTGGISVGQFLESPIGRWAS